MGGSRGKSREEQRRAAQSSAEQRALCAAAPRMAARGRCGARAGRIAGAERGRPRWLPGRRGAFAARRGSEVTALWERAGGGEGGRLAPVPFPGPAVPSDRLLSLENSHPRRTVGKPPLPGAAPRAFCRKCPGSSGCAIRLRKDVAGRDVVRNEAAGKHNKQQHM